MTVLEKILPRFIIEPLNKLNTEKLYELRLRSRSPLLINYGGDYKYVAFGGGITSNPDEAFTIAQEIPAVVLARACEFSLYAYNNKIKEGYISLEGGIRVGIAGETVYEGGEIKTIKNVSSLNIRIPHQIIGCSNPVFKYIFDNGQPLSTLIISPPGAGKTTMLRDIARNFSNLKKIYNVTLADERCELAAVKSGIPQLNVGFNTDIISCCKKEYAFVCALRTLSPDVIISDEIGCYQDLSACIDATYGGIAVIASAHAADLNELIKRKDFGENVKKAFKRFVTLSSRRGKGTIESITDGEDKIFYEAEK